MTAPTTKTDKQPEPVEEIEFSWWVPIVGVWIIVQCVVFFFALIFALMDRGRDYPSGVCKPPYSRFATYVAPAHRLACWLAKDADPELPDIQKILKGD